MYQAQILDLFFRLLRAGLWNKSVEDLSEFPLSTKSWEEIYRLSRQHTVLGLVCQGFSRLPDEFLPPQNLLLKWMVDVERIEQQNRKMNNVLSALIRLFRENNIYAVLQKGQGVAAMYDNPVLRECGDIDVYFPDKKHREKAEKLMQNGQKCTIKNLPDGSSCYSWLGIEIEHHPALIDLSRPKAQKYIEEIIAETPFEELDIDYDDSKITVSVPCPELNLALLNSHILKHALGVGIGLRQICDMARAYYILSKKVNDEELKKIYKSLGLFRWSRLLHSFLVKYLGLSAEYLPYKEKKLQSPEDLLNILLRGGNFGQYSKKRIKVASSLWKRKLDTARSFVSNVRFAVNYAPCEAFYTFKKLLLGQFS